MSAATKSPTEQILSAIGDLNKKVDAQANEIADLKKKAATPAGGLRPSQLFHATTGAVGQDSQPFQMFKLLAHVKGYLPPDAVKNELDISNRLKSWYDANGFNSICIHPQSILTPFSTAHMPPPETEAQEKTLTDTRQRLKAWQSLHTDPDEAGWIDAKVNGYYGGRFRKALGTIADSAGGVLVGFPTLGELIELQRNIEVFPQAGASEISLPPNGRIQFPKQTGGSVAYWVGEAATLTESTPATGYLDLQAKKLGVYVKLNNELLRFTSPTTEGLVRMDMALQAALKTDLGMLEGTGGTQIKGLITYDTQSAWVQGTDKLIAYTVTSNLFQPNDPADMEAVMPDQGGFPTAYLMRRNLWAKIQNRRNAAITTADAAAAFTWSHQRAVGDRIPEMLNGTKVVQSSQISNTRGSGAQTYVILGNFRDWLIGRFGVMEFLPNGLGDTPYLYDQTWLRGIQHIDAGPRHASSFVFADAITIS